MTTTTTKNAKTTKTGKTPASTASKAPTHEEIARRAYFIWLEAGKPTGSEQKHWAQAEAELRAAKAGKVETKAEPKVKTVAAAIKRKVTKALAPKAAKK